MRTLAIAVGLSVPLAPDLFADEQTQTFGTADLEFFESKIRPVLIERCFKCHGADKQEGELRLDSRALIVDGGGTGPAIVPGRPGDSLLVEAIEYDPTGYQMPPDGKLPEETIALLKEWIQRGAPWPAEDTPAAHKTVGDDWTSRRKHWSFQPIARPAVPDVSDPAWPTNPIDAFVMARLDTAGLKPAATVERSVWIRRVTYDLIGLPPTPGELENFLTDASPDAERRVVDRLLASPHYGERWGRHWLDLTRFAETGGHEFDYELDHVWRYRDYVVRALNADVPYDQFVREHVAGDRIASPRIDPADGTNQSLIGTAFYWLGQGKHSPVDLRAEECATVDNQIDVMTRTFLALTVSCARCHDHKFDAITAADYYALAGFLQSSRRQYADIGSQEALQRSLADIEQLHERSRDTSLQVLTANLRKRSAELRALLTATADSIPDEQQDPARLAAVKGLLDRAAQDPADPLYVVATWQSADRAVASRTIADQWAARASRSATADEQSQRFATFNGPDLPGWTNTRSAFEPITMEHQGPTLRIQTPHPLWLQPGRWNSGVLTPRAQGVLRSPTFVIEKPFIDYRVARLGGRDSPGRPLKNGQIHLIVDGFQFIKSPLYGQLSLNIPKDQPERWYRQDVRKFIGRKAYIEIVDEEPDGSMEIDEVRFADGPLAIDTPLPVVTDWWTALSGDESVGDALAVGNRFCDLLDKAVLRLQESADRPMNALGNDTALLDWLQKLPLNIDVQDALSPDESEQWGQVVREAEQLAARVPAPLPVAAMIDGTPENEHVLLRGNPRKPGEEVSRRFLSVFDAEPVRQPFGSGRLQLAEELTSPTNPLTARVIVNRLWQHHFGEGIVRSVDNFGILGRQPSHPELLDYLSNELVRNDWSLKHMHRLLVLSSTYRMSSRTDDPEADRVDPENVWLHKARIRRLEAEAIRDGLLAVAGAVNSQMEGPGVLPHLTPFMQGRGRPGASGPLDAGGRRSLYINVRRNFLTPMFLAFDFPTPMTTVGRRSSSNVPAQALTMLNNEFVLQQSARLAERLQRTYEDDDRRIDLAYRLLYSRAPTADERADLKAYLTADGEPSTETWAEACHVLVNTKEFLFLP